MDVFSSPPHLLFCLTLSRCFVLHFLGGESNRWGPTCRSTSKLLPSAPPCCLERIVRAAFCAGKPWGWRACPAELCNISMRINEHWSTSHADKQLSVLHTRRGIRRGTACNPELLTSLHHCCRYCDERCLLQAIYANVITTEFAPSPTHHTVQ